MEDYIKDNSDTASSNFYSFGRNDARASSEHPEGEDKAYQSAAHYNRVQQLQSKLMGLSSIVDQLKEHNTRIRQDTILDDQHQQKLANLEEIKAQNQVLEKQVKRDIFCKFQSLEKELQEIQKNRKSLKSKYQTLFRDGIDEVRSLKKETFAEITKLKDEGITEFRKKNQQLKKQCIGLRKFERSFKNELFGTLELTRANFCERLNTEEAKRNNLQNIIQVLLEKTCQKAENSIRRRLYQSPIMNRQMI